MSQLSLIDIYDQSPLDFKNDKWVNSQSGQTYSIVNDIPILLNEQYLTGSNEKYRKMYNWMGSGYDFFEKVIGKLFYGNSVQEARNQMMNTLSIKNNDKILYVSIGTGTNLNFISNSIDKSTLTIVGADISMGMLKKCKKNNKRWKLNIELISCCAEALPFPDNYFDVVFHVGGINFFNNKQKAIQEMIRVAKSKTKLMIADETEKLAKEQYEKSIFSKKYFVNREKAITAPVELIPTTMQSITCQTFWKDRFCCITFIKP